MRPPRARAACRAGRRQARPPGRTPPGRSRARWSSRARRGGAPRPPRPPWPGRPRSPADLVPVEHRRPVVLRAEQREAGGVEDEVPRALRLQPEVRGGQDPQAVAVPEQDHGLARPIDLGEQRPHALGHVGDGLPAGTAIAEQVPARPVLADLLGREALVVAVVELSERVDLLDPVAVSATFVRLVWRRVTVHSVSPCLARYSSGDELNAALPAV